MTPEDKKFVKNNSHFGTNRFTLSDDETTIFAGSNYEFNPDGLAALEDRFELGDYSKPQDQIEKRREALEKKAKEKKKKN